MVFDFDNIKLLLFLLCWSVLVFVLLRLLFQVAFSNGTSLGKYYSQFPF